jgi:uncharacterized cupin superfamily protein
MAFRMMIASAVAFAVRAAPVVATLPVEGRLVAGSLDGQPMRPAPIEPSWIVEGAPVARFAEHSHGSDDAAITGVWDCTAGAFRWHFGWDETVLILEGEVLVTSADGTERRLRAGEVAYFTAGSWYTWRVDSYVKKLAFCRKPFPRPLTIAYRLRNLLRTGSL